MRRFLDVLGDEWMELSGSRAAVQALAEWGDPAFDGFADLRDAVAAVQRRGRPEESDRILLALLRRAGTDNLAARAVLQALMPGLKTLMVAYQWAGDSEEVATAVVEAAFERIRHYPCHRRPARVAANVLADTRQVLWRDACRERQIRIASEPLVDGLHPRAAGLADRPSATEELVELVCHAVREAELPVEGARLIVLTRILDVPVEALASETGGKPQTIRKRRRKAEAVLAKAAA